MQNVDANLDVAKCPDSSHIPCMQKSDPKKVNFNNVKAADLKKNKRIVITAPNDDSFEMNHSLRI